MEIIAFGQCEKMLRLSGESRGLVCPFDLDPDHAVAGKVCLGMPESQPKQRHPKETAYAIDAGGKEHYVESSGRMQQTPQRNNFVRAGCARRGLRVFKGRLYSFELKARCVALRKIDRRRPSVSAALDARIEVDGYIERIFPSEKMIRGNPNRDGSGKDAEPGPPEPPAHRPDRQAIYGDEQKKETNANAPPDHDD